MKPKCKWFISAILCVGIIICFVAYPPKMHAGEAKDKDHGNWIEIMPQTHSYQTQPKMRQMNKPKPEPKQEPDLPIVPLLNLCERCQKSCVDFKGESYASYCHGMWFGVVGVKSNISEEAYLFKISLR